MAEDRNESPDGAAETPAPDDADRTRRYLRGSADAFIEVDQWIQIALRRRYPGLAEEHEDLAQVVHAKLVSSLKDGRYSRGRSLRAYVSGVVHHAAIDRLRELYRVRLMKIEISHRPPPDDARDPYRALRRTDEDDLFRQALLAVPKRCREMWRLMFVERLTYEEIGERLSIPAGTVKSRMWHCRRKALAALRRLRFLRTSPRSARRSPRDRSDP